MSREREGIVMTIKKMCKLVLGLAICVMCFVSIKENIQATVIYLPDDDYFVVQNKDNGKIEEHGRGYLITENTKYYSEPNGEFLNVALDGFFVNVYYTYNDGDSVWGCIGKNIWIEMDTVNLVYDNIEFMKDNESKITDYNNELQGYTLKLPIKLYEYPKCEHRNEITKVGKDLSVSLSSWLTPSKVYTDEEGKIWGYVQSYNWGPVEGWYCINDLEKGDVIEEIAGDINFDCKVDLKDAGEILRASLGMRQLSKGQIINSDVNKDEKVNLKDTSIVLKTALGIGSVDSQIMEKKVHLSVERVSDDSNKITYTIFNNTDEAVAYGYDLGLEKYTDGKWEKVKYSSDYIIPGIGIVIMPLGTQSEAVNLSRYFDDLTEGTYRLKKHIGSYVYYAEFQL